MSGVTFCGGTLMTRRYTKLPSHEPVQGVLISRVWWLYDNVRPQVQLYVSLVCTYMYIQNSDQHRELEMVGLTPSPVLYRPGCVYIRAEMKVIVSHSNLCLHNIQSHRTFFNCTHRKYNRVQQNESSIICFLLALGV